MADALAQLIRELQNAHAGEVAAGFAYRGHWKSARDPEERAHIRKIEEEEAHHRQLVAGMLQKLGAKPRPLRDFTFFCIGNVLGVVCHLSGWFLPMYGAGRLERRNIVEYERAALYASQCGHDDLIECMLGMAEVEWDHEHYFRMKVTGHRMLRIFPMWDEAPPRESIRRRYLEGERRLA